MQVISIWSLSFSLSVFKTFCGPWLIWLLLDHTDVSSKTNIFQSSRDNYVKFSSFSSMMVTASQGKSEKWLKDSQFNILGCLFWSRIYGHDISGSKIHSLQVKRGKPLTNRFSCIIQNMSIVDYFHSDMICLCYVASRITPTAFRSPISIVKYYSSI